MLGDALHVRRDHLPEQWGGVDAYVQAMIDDVLVDNDVVQEVKRAAGRVKGTPPVSWMPRGAWNTASRPAGPVLRLLGTGLLPSELRRRYGMRWTASDEAMFQAWCRASKASGRVLPRSVRQSGPRMLRVRRGEIGPFGVPNRSRPTPAQA
jgi:uncharacterized protein (DUF2236 family)